VRGVGVMKVETLGEICTPEELFDFAPDFRPVRIFWLNCWPTWSCFHVARARFRSRIGIVRVTFNNWGRGSAKGITCRTAERFLRNRRGSRHWATNLWVERVSWVRLIDIDQLVRRRVQGYAEYLIPG